MRIICNALFESDLWGRGEGGTNNILTYGETGSWDKKGQDPP